MKTHRTNKRAFANNDWNFLNQHGIDDGYNMFSVEIKNVPNSYAPERTIPVPV